jgi:hypothetical protein
MKLEVNLVELISLKDSICLLNKSKLFEEYIINNIDFVYDTYEKDIKNVSFKESHIIFAIKVHNMFYESLERIANKECKI